MYNIDVPQDLCAPGNSIISYIWTFSVFRNGETHWGRDHHSAEIMEDVFSSGSREMTLRRKAARNSDEISTSVMVMSLTPKTNKTVTETTNQRPTHPQAEHPGGGSLFTSPEEPFCVKIECSPPACVGFPGLLRSPPTV